MSFIKTPESHLILWSSRLTSKCIPSRMDFLPCVIEIELPFLTHMFLVLMLISLLIFKIGISLLLLLLLLCIDQVECFIRKGLLSELYNTRTMGECCSF